MFKKNYIVILSVFLAAGIFFVITYYREDGIKLQPSFQTSSMKNLHLTHREGNDIKWALSAEEATFPVGSREIFLRSLRIKINRSPEIYVTGGSGVYVVEKGEVALEKSVSLNIRDTTFTTDSIKWDSENELLTTEDDIRFNGKNFLIEGTGLAASAKKQKVQILKNVKATFNLI